MSMTSWRLSSLSRRIVITLDSDLIDALVTEEAQASLRVDTLRPQCESSSRVPKAAADLRINRQVLTKKEKQGTGAGWRPVW